MNSPQKSALIVGASRGLGFAITEELLKRGWKVTGTCRGGKTPLHEITKKFPQTLEIENVDITNYEEIKKLKSHLKEKTFDVLFVNAGIAGDGGMGQTIGNVSTEEFIKVMVTNSLSPMKVIEQLKDQVRKGGTIGAMSSGQGSITDNNSGVNDLYRASKTALNMLMKGFAVREEKNHPVILLAPGWIKTDMGGENARFTVEETIGDIVNTITGQEGRNGLHYVDRFGKTVQW
jgi:NAD(P)-dependent dehydrogenase (short-subunit alcohol dehydrogenase family)